MAKQRGWMPFFIDDYRADTIGLSTECHGAYLLLIFALWDHETLPAESKTLARITFVSPRRWPKIWADIERFFEVDDNRISHKRVTAELTKAKAISEKRRNAQSRVNETKNGKAQRDLNSDKSLKTLEPSEAFDTSKGDTLTLNTNKEQINDRQETQAQAELLPVPDGGGFHGKAIKLSARELAKWEKIYINIANLRAELFGLDDWASKRDGVTLEHVKSVLRKRDNENRATVIEATAAKQETGNLWEFRLKEWREKKFWGKLWGPEPGKPGCFVPVELLQGTRCTVSSGVGMG